MNADYYTKYNQNVTAYSASKYKTNGNTRFVASGLVPKAGYVAMRNDAPVPFGSTVTTPSTIMQGDGQSFSSFSVQDRGVSTSLHLMQLIYGGGFAGIKRIQDQVLPY